MISEIWNKLDPGFFAPIWLAVGFLALIAVSLLELGAWRRRKHAIRVFTATHLLKTLTGSVSPIKRILKRLLLLAAVGFLFIALARPHLLYDWREENRTGLDVLFAVDCSESMMTEDVKPNRIERAKLAIADFALRVPDNRLGLVAFAGDAFLQCPLTLDHDAFESAVRELDINSIPRPGTDIATAIDQAVLAFNSQPNNLKILVLVTDGEDLEGRVLESAKSAAQAGLKIYTVGVGTPQGDQIPERDDNGAIMYHHDNSGQIVISKLDENTLQQIASITGGAYVQLGKRGEGLDEIYNRYIAPLPKQHFEERREKIRIERYEWPLALAVLCLMLEFMINERASFTPAVPVPNLTHRPPHRRRPARNALTVAPLLALGLLLGGWSENARSATADTAERDYKAGQYQQALDHYRQATVAQPDRTDLQYNRGDAAYKAGEYSEAEEAFRKALETPDLNLQEKSYYNLGNSQFKHGEAMQQVDKNKTINFWEQALHSYDSALKLTPTADAKHNYEFVKEKLEELKKQQQQQQQKNQQQSQPKKDDQSKEKQSQSDGKGQGEQNKDQQNQPGQSNPKNDSQNSQPKQQPGEQSQQQQQQQPQPGSGDQGKDNQQPQQQPSDGQGKETGQQSAYSGGRSEDKQDPGAKSRQEAEALLDSLKDDERHVTARSLNGGNTAPPPPSGKDW